YRERVLEMRLRELSMFQLLSADDFKQIKDKVELLRVPPGTVLWDEGDTADCVYVVRNGIIQVVQRYPWKMTEAAVTDWTKLSKSLTAENPPPPIDYVRKALPKSLQDGLKASESEMSSELKKEIVSALNEVSKTLAPLIAKETKDLRQDSRYARECAA